MIKAVSHNMQSLALCLMCCIVNMMCFLESHHMQHKCNARIESVSIYASAGLHFKKNQFSEFYNNALDTMQGYASLCEPYLRATLRCTKSVLKLITDIYSIIIDFPNEEI